MDTLTHSNYAPASQVAGPQIGYCKHYLELLINDNNARGAVANDEVNKAKDMLKRLEDVRLP